jgi:hypothetical protein
MADQQDPYGHYGTAPRQAPQQPLPPRSAPRAKAPAPKKEMSRKARLGCLTAFLAAAGIIVLVFILMSGGPSASYRARVTGWTVVDPADISVSFRVTNTGKAAGAPDCTVQASSPTGSYSGINEGTLSGQIAPGSSAVTAMPVTITGQGARYVTQVTVSCQ